MGSPTLQYFRHPPASSWRGPLYSLDLLSEFSWSLMTCGYFSCQETWTKVLEETVQ